MADFDERSGVIPCHTEWGSWWQTTDEVHVEVNLTSEVKSKDIKCTIKPKQISLTIQGKKVFEGELRETVVADESIWTLEDRKFLRILLIKSRKGADKCWDSLLVGQYATDPLTQDQMQQKLTLQRFQLENPGFDFSGAEITGNYHGGGPELPNS